MAISVFEDKTKRPSKKEMADATGAKKEIWENLTAYVAGTHKPSEEYKFYGKSYGWALQLRKNGKALVTLYPQKDGFTAQIILGSEQATAALKRPLVRITKKIINEAHPYPEGRWLFIPVESEKDLSDVKELLLVKSNHGKDEKR